MFASILWGFLTIKECIMSNDEIIRIISTLSKSVDTLTRAGREEDAGIVVKKMLEFVNKLE